MSSNKRPKGNPKKHPNQQKAEADVAQGMRPNGLLTPAEIVASCTVHRTIGEDQTFGRCSTALQLLPNNAVLLLVTDKSEEDADRAHTFLLGEEVTGFSVEHSMIETADAPSIVT